MHDSHAISKKAFRGMGPFACALAIFLFFGGTLYGQNTVGAILGTATSTDGAFVPNVSVTVSDEGTHASRNATTGQQGQYVVSGLNPSTYTVTG
jgi:hypothetical protein